LQQGALPRVVGSKSGLDREEVLSRRGPQPLAFPKGVDKKYGQKLRPEDTQTIAQAFLGLAHMDRDFAAKFAAPSTVSPPTPRPTPIVENTCLQCGVPVEPKVVSFCRLKSKQLGGRILCRACQRPFLAAN
jgi:hypothetical protein